MEPLADLSRRAAEAIRSATTTLNVPAGFPGSDLMTRYAEQLAESVDLLHRLAEEGAAMVDPILIYAARVSDVTDSWIDLLRPQNES
jgi:hypothetical protein